jgi:hypothetical protein
VEARILALTAAFAIALLASAVSSAQPQTTQPSPVVIVKITITDSEISVSPKRAERGSIARFILVNHGKKLHVFRLGYLSGPRAAEAGFTRALRPGAQHILAYFLDYREQLPYSGRLPADRSNPKMRGTFTIF